MLLAATAEVARGGDVEAGRRKSMPCAACHGPDGNAMIPGVPTIAGQPNFFTHWQLIKYRDGRRKDPQMSAQAEQLSDTDMEDFFYAGGLPAVLRELLPLLHREALTVNGKTLGENVAGAENWNRDVIRPLEMPLAPEGGTVILTGNLCPDGAVLKQSAASSHLLTHRGRAVVFEDHADLHARIDDPSLPVDETSVLVLKRVGPKGAPGMPEWGAAPIPARLLKAGVKDMDLLCGTDGIRRIIERGGSLRALEASWTPALARFARARRPYLLYS